MVQDVASPSQVSQAVDALRVNMPVSRVDTYFQRNREYVAAHPSEVFPSGRVGGGVYTRDLIGTPFLVCSAWMYRRQDARTVNTADGRQFTFAAQDVVQVYVAKLYLNQHGEWQIDPPELATLNGAYLVNQFRGLAPSDLEGAGVFTIAENPAYTTKGGQHPKMLKRFDPDADLADDDDDGMIHSAIEAPSADEMAKQAARYGLSYGKKPSRPSKG